MWQAYCEKFGECRFNKDTEQDAQWVGDYISGGE